MYEDIDWSNILPIVPSLPLHDLRAKVMDLEILF